MVFLPSGSAKIINHSKIGIRIENHANSEKYHVSHSVHNRLKTAKHFEQRSLFGGINFGLYSSPGLKPQPVPMFLIGRLYVGHPYRVWDWVLHKILAVNWSPKCN